MRDDLVFELGQRRQQFAGFKRLHDESVSLNATSLVRFERFQLAHGEQYGNARRLGRFAEALAHFEAAITGHINIEHDQVRFRFRNFLEGCRSVVHRSDVVTGVAKDSPAHVLGSHAIIGEQDFPRQAMSFM